MPMGDHAVCEAIGCAGKAETEDLFCERCWDLLYPSLQYALLNRRTEPNGRDIVVIVMAIATIGLRAGVLTEKGAHAVVRVERDMQGALTESDQAHLLMLANAVKAESTAAAARPVPRRVEAPGA